MYIRNMQLIPNRKVASKKKRGFSMHADTKIFITSSHRFVFLTENGGLSEVNIFKGIMNSDCLGRTFWL